MTRPASAMRDADLVSAELEACGENVVRVGPASWAFEIRSGETTSVRAELADHWLELTTTLDLEPGSDLPWRLLEWNGSLPAGCRLVLAADGRPALRAEVRCGEPIAGEPGVPALCALLGETAGALRWRGTADPPPSAASAATESAIGPRWIQLLGEAGWSPKELALDAIGLEFTVRGATRRIRITRTCGGVRVAAELAREGSMSPASREALGTLLLRASAMLRRVRAAAGTDEGGDAVRVEMVVPDNSSDPEAEFAVGGVVLAAQQFGPEASALVQVPLAVAYLEIISQGRGRCGSTQAPALMCSK